MSYWTNRRSEYGPIHSDICRRLVPSVPWGPPSAYAESQKKDPDWWAGPFETIEEAKAAHPRPAWVHSRSTDIDSYDDGWLCECVTEGTRGSSVMHDAQWAAWDNRHETARDLAALREELA